MQTNIFTSPEYLRFKTQILEEVKTMIKNNTAPREWFRAHEVCYMLKVSSSTLYNFRNKGLLPCSKMGGVVLYNIEDIKRMVSIHKAVKK